jgi:hypothetical protein
LLSALVPVHALAPRSRNLERWLGAVAHDAPHGLEILPVPLAVVTTPEAETTPTT